MKNRTTAFPGRRVRPSTARKGRRTSRGSRHTPCAVRVLRHTECAYYFEIRQLILTQRLIDSPVLRCWRREELAGWSIGGHPLVRHPQGRVDGAGETETEPGRGRARQVGAVRGRCGTCGVAFGAVSATGRCCPPAPARRPVVRSNPPRPPQPRPTTGRQVRRGGGCRGGQRYVWPAGHGCGAVRQRTSLPELKQGARRRAEHPVNLVDDDLVDPVGSNQCRSGSPPRQTSKAVPGSTSQLTISVQPDSGYTGLPWNTPSLLVTYRFRHLSTLGGIGCIRLASTMIISGTRRPHDLNSCADQAHIRPPRLCPTMTSGRGSEHSICGRAKVQEVTSASYPRQRSFWREIVHPQREDFEYPGSTRILGAHAGIPSAVHRSDPLAEQQHRGRRDRHQPPAHPARASTRVAGFAGDLRGLFR